jgi:hypothetical protein
LARLVKIFRGVPKLCNLGLVDVSIRGYSKGVYTMFWGTHEIWGAWCMIISLMVHDGFGHKRHSVMDFHIGDGLVSGFLTSIKCLHDILP